MFYVIECYHWFHPALSKDWTAAWYWHLYARNYARNEKTKKGSYQLISLFECFYRRLVKELIK
jgi:hypothetical protein